MSTLVLSISESQIFTTLRTFLLGILPSGVEVVQGQESRVGEPNVDNFVTMTPIFRTRLAWNTDSYADTETLGFASFDNIPAVGDVLVNGSSIAQGIVLAVDGLLVTLTPGAGEYFALADVVTNQTTTLPVGTVTSVAYGGKAMLQPTQVTIQLDVHGSSSGDNAQVISTTFRDAYAFDQFAASGLDIRPLYTSDPHQIPFVNSEQQYEERWVIDVHMQANPTVIVTMQAASALVVGIIDVDAAYPPI